MSGTGRRIMVVGATGFLGAVVVERLVDRQPLALVRASSDRAVLPGSVTIRQGDLDDPDSLPLDDVDDLIYCASMGFGHIPGFLRRLERSPVKRAILVSTTAIFTSLPARSRAPRVEAEEAVRRSTLNWTIVRPTMIYGTGRDRNISRLLRFLKSWPVFPLCGNALWQPVHVADLAQAITAALDEPRAIGQTYDLPGRDPLSFSALVRVAAAAVGRSVLLVPVPLEAAVLAARVTGIVTPEQIRRLAEDKAFSYAPATRDLGFQPRPFEDGVRDEARLLGLAPPGH